MISMSLMSLPIPNAMSRQGTGRRSENAPGLQTTGGETETEGITQKSPSQANAKPMPSQWTLGFLQFSSGFPMVLKRQ